MRTKKNIVFCMAVLCTIGLLTFIYNCRNPETASEYHTPPIIATHPTGGHFVGSQTCIECHADIYSSHIKTAHYNTSANADSSNIMGNFASNHNILDLESVKLTLFLDEASAYQQSEIKNRTVKKDSEKFDIVIGSGVRGQSYFTWKEDKLFQLQASYYRPANTWVNSPGFPSYSIERPIHDACLKCHVTFAKNKNSLGHGNQYNKKQIILGIDCERCHRPAEKHVSYHQKNRGALTSKYIMKYDTLTRQQRLDACAQCHSGLRDQIIKGNSFSFLAGDNLNEYAQNFKPSNTNKTLDVHGNQYGLLVRSKCFKKTSTMDCTTCHNPHSNQRNNTTYFNAKCMNCHNQATVICSAETSAKKQMKNNCIACHMPVSPSKVMAVQLTNDSVETSFNIRSHLIAIYANKPE